ncbi:MAG: GNAT family N-acetyltransferase [Clostridia bacterium]|nr:GNAT family N-acetyltransferase [Clostridia bacterium]
MDNKKILKIAMAQSAVDLSADPADFEKSENVIVTSKENIGARRYLKLPFSCQLVSYGSNVVASVSDGFREITEDYITAYPTEHLFETPHLHVLGKALEEKGQRICFMAEYFLPDVDLLRVLDCPYETRILQQSDFAELYLPEWSNALCEKRRELDVLGVGAYHNGRLIGLAGCSADCDSMWQIGIDVLPEYRRQGVASALTSRLAAEVLDRGKVPFYCAAWCNVRSVRNAIKSGFRPAWVEMTAKPCDEVDKMNQRDGADTKESPGESK